MNPATLIFTGLLAIPPTWGSFQSYNFEQAQVAWGNVPTDAHVLTALPPTATAINISRPSDYYMAFESTEDARRASIERLQNKIVEFRMNPLSDSDDSDKDQIRSAAEVAKTLIAGIPKNLPLPKVMLLSSQISLYWDFGETYAELAISGNGQLSMYGRQQGKEDILVDTSLTDLRMSGLLFPNNLDRVLISS